MRWNGTMRQQTIVINSSAAAASTECIFQVVLLDNRTVDLSINIKSTVGDLFDKVCQELGLDERDIFGLARRIKNEYHFLPNELKLNKLVDFNRQCKNADEWIKSESGDKDQVMEQASTAASHHTFAHKLLNNLNASLLQIAKIKHATSLASLIQRNSSTSVDRTGSSLSTSTSNTSSSSSTTPTIKSASDLNAKLYFRVKFYVNDPLLLGSNQTRQLYYAQLRQNFVNINTRLNDERYFLLASLALVADFGPYDSTLHVNKYFDPSAYFPQWLIKKLGEEYIYGNMARLHEQQSHLSIEKAVNKYCIELSSSDDYPFNLHLYTVSKRKEEETGSICLGISPRGILVFETMRAESSRVEISLMATFAWSTVVKLNSYSRRFEVHTSNNNNKYVYYTANDRLSKYLLELSKQTHAFTINVFARLANQKQLSNYESYADKMTYLIDPQPDVFQEREIREISPIHDKKTTPVDDSSTSSSSLLDQRNSNELKSSFKALLSSTNQSTSSCTQSSDSSDYHHLFESTSNHSRKNSVNEECCNCPDTCGVENKLNSTAITDQLIVKNVASNIYEDLSAFRAPSMMLEDDFSFGSMIERCRSLEDEKRTLQMSQDSLEGASSTFVGQRQLNSSLIRPPPPPLPQSVPSDNNDTLFSHLLISHPVSSSYQLTRATEAVRPVIHNEFILNDSILLTTDTCLLDNNNFLNSTHQYHTPPNLSSSFVSPYSIKYKKPPSYEESLRKFKKNSFNSSSFSSSSASSGNHDENIQSPPSSFNSSNQQEQIESRLEKSECDDDKEEEAALSLESLEKIRMKAASMSLPLLTALCSDESLIRSLNVQKKLTQ